MGVSGTPTLAFLHPWLNSPMACVYLNLAELGTVVGAVVKFYQEVIKKIYTCTFTKCIYM